MKHEAVDDEDTKADVFKVKDYKVSEDKTKREAVDDNAWTHRRKEWTLHRSKNTTRRHKENTLHRCKHIAESL